MKTLLSLTAFALLLTCCTPKEKPVVETQDSVIVEPEPFVETDTTTITIPKDSTVKQ